MFVIARFYLMHTDNADNENVSSNICKMTLLMIICVIIAAEMDRDSDTQFTSTSVMRTLSLSISSSQTTSGKLHRSGHRIGFHCRCFKTDRLT